MRIGTTADIHINFLSAEEIARLVLEIRNLNIEAFVISGDIGEFSTCIPMLRMMEAELEMPIFFVLGNHDFYRGSIVVQRMAIEKEFETSKNIHYLSTMAPRFLDNKAIIIGHDGWGDARAGNFEASDFNRIMNDFNLISELKDGDRPLSKNRQRKAMEALAKQSLDHIIDVLPTALSIPEAEHIILSTHVPPWEVASRHEGRISSDDTLPFYCNEKLGAFLKPMMQANANKKMTVLCGHTHNGYETDILPNLKCIVSGSDYHKPEIRVIET